MNDNKQGNREKSNGSKTSEPQKAGKSKAPIENVNVSNGNIDIVSTDLCTNLAAIKQKFGIPQNQDIHIREFNVGRKLKAFIVYVENMVDKKTINLSILPNLMVKDVLQELQEEDPVNYLIQNVLAVQGLQKSNDYSQIIKSILSGDSVLFVEGCSECILIETKGFEKRNIEKPVIETVVMGPQEGFTENLKQI